ncbi:MAG: transglutaminase domain-containing protein [Acidimicrobiales bacterium]
MSVPPGARAQTGAGATTRTSGASAPSRTSAQTASRVEAGGQEPGGFFEMVRRANAPHAPENSFLFRISTLVAVLVGVFACSSVGEVSSSSALVAGFAIAIGMTFSAVTRHRPWQWVKILLAGAVIAVFVQFVAQVFGAAHTGELSSIEVPLAGLFTWVQVVHAFDVPARRDLLFSVAAAGALVTVAAAQAVSAGFLAWVALWLVATVIALACSWRSMAGGRGPLPLVGLLGATIVVLVMAVLLDAVLPPPRASQEITLPNSLTSYLALPANGGLTEGGADPTEPAKAGRPGGVGGYVGMAGPLNTALRGTLGNQIVMRVRANTPGYFLGLTYTSWNGQSWTNPGGCVEEIQDTGSPFTMPFEPPWGGSPVPVALGESTGSANIQTFYVEQSLPNILFATSEPAQIYFPDHKLIFGCDNSIRSAIAMTPGTVYTVISQDDEATPAQLRGVPVSAITPALQRRFHLDLQLPAPNPYRRVEALARSVIAQAHASTLIGEVQALETWMGAHTQYSTNIPPLLPGQDAVNEFLFGNRTGYCEQISTALAVMLRSIGVPAREATGYVPGPFDPLSDLYEIQAKDAHAWVQVYFPGHGWQSFDPTTYVPLAPADPGTVLLSDLWHLIAGLPWVPIGIVAGAVAAALGRRFEIRRRLARPKTWAGRLALRLERAGARAGIPRRSAETLAEYAERLRTAAPARGLAGLPDVVELLSLSAYGGRQPSEAERLHAEETVKSMRAALGRKWRRRGRAVVRIS